jgi:two-component system OmpR family sensor kinase
MHADAAAQAFERFYQASPDRTTPGSGLGLSIVRSIIERHGGTVELNSTPDEGTTVRLRIPASA